MNNFISNISELILFYEAEISQLKKIAVNAKLEALERNLIIKYSIPILYSHWEGFFVKSLVEYVNFINSQSIGLGEVKDELLAHCLDEKVNIRNSRYDFGKMKQHALNIKSFFQQSRFYLSTRIDTKSNLNYKNANNILNRLCLNNLPVTREKGLSKLLMYRNNIAHGECSLPSNFDIINQMSEIVINSMYDLFILIEEGINNRQFIKT